MNINMQFPQLLCTMTNKKQFKNVMEYVGTEKRQEQDKDGPLATKLNTTSS